MDAALAARLTLLRLAVAALLAAAPALALAFGPLGHEIVAEIAARELDADTRAAVERLLGERASPGLREVSTWADRAREQPKYRDTASLHYINMPDGTCAYEPRRDCPGGRCVAGALARWVAVLGDARRADAERAEALRWVVHLVADLHQPMHVGRKADRGGNLVQLRLGRAGTNLHKVWDSDLLTESGRLRGRPWRAVDYADALRARGRPAADLAWSAGASAAWVRESCTLMRAAYPAQRRIGRDYVERHLPQLERRLAEAGYRLAALLDATLTP
jgi:hypothetical protein